MVKPPATEMFDDCQGASSISIPAKGMPRDVNVVRDDPDTGGAMDTGDDQTMDKEIVVGDVAGERRFPDTELAAVTTGGAGGIAEVAGTAG